MKPATFRSGTRRAKSAAAIRQQEPSAPCFITRDEEQRFVFDFDEPPGLLHIFGPAQIEPIEGNVEMSARFRLTAVNPLETGYSEPDHRIPAD